MKGVRSVLVGAMVMAALCIIVSTWVSVGELRQIVDDAEKKSAHKLQNAPHNWKLMAERALEHIEHLPHVPHGVHIPHYKLMNGGESGVSDKKEVDSKASISPNQSAKPEEFKPGDDLITAAGMCYVFPHTDYYGEAVKAGGTNKKATAGECCEDCLNFEPAGPDDSGCNVWVWCGDKEACGAQFQHCWLKHLPWVYATKPKMGPTVPWTSGLLEAPSVRPKDVANSKTNAGGGPERAYHVVTSAQGTATHWQIRIHYYWYKKQQKKCRDQYGDSCHMGGFTRLLHSGFADELTAEIPTFVANPLPSGNKGYVVLNRPYAFLQWTQKARIKEKYILMSEPDHVFMLPLQNPMKGDLPAAFPFFYIEPSKKEYVHITQKFIGRDKTRKDCEQIAPIGSSPTFLTFEDLKTVSPHWVNTSIAIFEDPESNKEWGWVMEMYAFTIALYNNHIGPVGLHLELASQPPWDTTMDMNGVPYNILHYTYGMDYTLEGVFTPGKIGAWRFDKRSYAGRPPPRHLGKPPDGMQNDLVRFLINAINEATDAIPGWDEYSSTGKATQFKTYSDK